MNPFVPTRVQGLLALLALLAGGCAYGLLSQESQLYMNSRYGRLIQEVEARSPAVSRATVQDLYWLSLGYAKAKDYGRLFPCLDELQRRIDAGVPTRPGDYLYFGDIVHLPHLIRSEALIDLGRYDESAREAETALGKAREMDAISTRTFAYGYLGIAHALRGDRERALRAARSLAETPTMGVLGEENASGLARIHLALGDYEKALGIMRRSEGAARLSGLVDLMGGAPLVGQSAFVHAELPRLYMLAKCLLETGGREEAKAGLDRLLALPATAENNDIYWMVLTDRGRIAEEEGDEEQALDLYRRAIEVIERLRSTIHTEASKIGFVGDKQGVYFRAVTLLLARERCEEAFTYAERAKARALVDLLASRRQFAIRSAHASEARAVLARLDRTEANARVQGEDLTLKQYASRRGLILQARETLRKQAPDLASLVTVNAAPIRSIQAGLLPDETLVEYYGHGEGLYAFVLNRDGLRGLALDGKALGRDVAAFREALADPGSGAHRSVSRRLYGRLIAPVEAALQGPYLLVVPHGALHYLPFHALQSASGYLIDRFALRTLPSSSVIPLLKKERSAFSSLFALGNPDLGDPRLDLAFAQDEAARIGRDVPGAEVLLRKEATETALKEQGGRYRIIHVASHGRFNPEKPLASGLMLVPDEKNDGLLTVGELYDLELDADLVCLSACETALGAVESGDDVVGFTRGFLYAGAGALVSSLWSVDDRATFELMTRFYENMKSLPARDALREAQLSVKAERPHPFYWAAFQITGR